MATLPSNSFQNVITFQKAEMAFLLNSFCALNLANKKFQNFDSMTANLGDTISFDLMPRFTTYNGLVITQQPSVQRVQQLVCSQAVNTSSGYSDQQFIFNVREYMDRFGASAVKEIGSVIEADLLRNIISGVRINDPQNANFGALQTNSGPYRFFGDGFTPVNSFGQLAQAIANFKDYGSDKDDLCGILPMTVVPQIVNSGLGQFAPNRNNDLAMSWELGTFGGCSWYESNLLPIHTSGTVGDTAAPGNVLTLVSTNDPTGANITQITFSGAGISDDNAIKAGDLFQFNDGVSNRPNLRFLSFIGHQPTNQPVQFRATADAISDGSGNVVISITPALVSVQNQNQNLNNALQAGMQVTVAPSHRAGVIWSGKPLYLAMPKLPNLDPFDTVSQTDSDSGVSLRHYWGSQFGQNVRSYVRDAIYGSTLVPERCQRLLFPL
jgi:hypothetical protein